MRAYATLPPIDAEAIEDDTVLSLKKQPRHPDGQNSWQRENRTYYAKQKRSRAKKVA